MSAAVDPDWQWWARAWDAHMIGFMPDRAVPLAIMSSLLGDHVGPQGRVIELGSGTGTWAAAMCEVLPHAQVIAVELDPLLVRIGQEVHGAVDQLEWAEVDLRDPAWPDGVPGPADALASTAVLHMLGQDGAQAAYGAAHRALREGGMILTLDWAAPDIPDATLAARVRNLSEARLAAGGPTAFWQHQAAIDADPLLADLDARRRARFGPPPAEEPPYLSAAAHDAALRAAGFSSVTTLWRTLDMALIVAIA